MRTKSFFAAAVCAVAVAGASAGAAFAGEVIGPPGTPGVPGSGSGVSTAAPEHANSACAFSGLNDLNPGQGPIDFIVQSPGQTMRAGLTGPGVPGHGGIPGFPNGCRGGSNPENPPSP
jgi:hypothetical protein